MKRKLFISVVSLFVAVAAIAQTNHYPGTSGTIIRDGYTYKYRDAKTTSGLPLSSSIDLYNMANPYLDMEWGYSDGTQMPFEVSMGDTELFTNASMGMRQTLDMVDGLFTAQQKAMLKDNNMLIQLRISPSTGKVADIYFRFFRNSPFTFIPVETYRSIEMALKENLTVTPTAVGNKMTYLLLYWAQEF